MRLSLLEASKSLILNCSFGRDGVKNSPTIRAMLEASQAPAAPRAPKVGTMSIDDLRAVDWQSAAAFGLNTISEVFQRDLAIHSQITADLVSFIAVPTSDRQRIQGTSDQGEMYEVDEFGRAPTQKVSGGTTVGFPMRLFQYNLGWTRKYLQNATPAELVDQMTAAKDAHVRKIARDLRRAIYLSGNFTFNDFLVDKIDFAVKRLLNADGSKVPGGPNGETFDGSTHTHYLAVSGITATALTNAVNTVVEHGFGNQVMIVIDQADEAAVRGLAGFTAYVDPRLTLGTANNQATKRLDITRLNNRAIGLFAAAEVWVKPWGLASYPLVFDSGSPMKPAVLRTRNGVTPALEIAAELDTYPLYAQYMESEFGFGVWNRANGAVLYTGGGSYVDPTIP